MNVSKFLPYILILLLSIGCSSALKKQCKNTNWYKLGKNIALSGESIYADAFSKRCESKNVEVDTKARDEGYKAGLGEYCSKQSIYKKGKSGLSANIQICPEEIQKTRTSTYTKGLRLYCDPTNAYLVGSRGLPLNPICPEDLSKGYYRQYNKGRSIYLLEAIKKDRAELVEIKRELPKVERELSLKRQEFEVLDVVPDMNTEGESSAIDGLNIAKTALNKRRNSLRNKINLLSRKVSKLENRKLLLETNISNAETEVKALKAKR